MIIEKSYHFYAAHRNEMLHDKCFSLHGHQYNLLVLFEVPRPDPRTGVTSLFSNFDVVDTMLKKTYDHSLLINTHDPLLKYLLQYQVDCKTHLRTRTFDKPTSVENVAFALYADITCFGFWVAGLILQETVTSRISFTRSDYIAELKRRQLTDPRFLQVENERKCHAASFHPSEHTAS